MSGTRHAVRLLGIFAILVMWLLASLPETRAEATAALTTIHSFSANDGSVGTDNLVEGTDGNFYGAVLSSETAVSGTLLRITPAGVVTTLYTFPGLSGPSQPSPLVLGNDGNFYGTALSNSGDIMFQLTPGGTLTTVLRFNSSAGSACTGLVLGSDGNFYGATEFGGTGNDGTMFEISPEGVQTVLHNFTDEETGGAKPTGPLVQGKDGNLYGITQGFENQMNIGTLFKITTAGAITTLYQFVSGGIGPLLAASNGNIYCGYAGMILAVTPAGAVNTLYSIKGEVEAPSIGVLVEGSDGNFYGTVPTGASGSGVTGDNGYIFQLTPAGLFTVLHSFSGSDGSDTGALVQSRNGSFYGLTFGGGANDAGSFYELTVTGLSTFFTGEILLADSVYYLQFANGNCFGFYSFLGDLDYLYHFDLGYEYVFDADDGRNGVYLYDFASNDFFYTSPTFPFPYLYDSGLNSVLYYYPDTNHPGHYTTNPRYFYDFATSQIITK